MISDKFWKRENKSIRRKSGNKGEPSPSFLIVCEGEKTEPNYFEAFGRKIKSVKVKVHGAARNTKSLVEFTKEIIRDKKINHEEYDQVWCVFDRDSFTLDNFNAAFDIAKNKIPPRQFIYWSRN